MKTLRYFVWNFFLVGTLSMGYFLNAMDTSGTIIGWLYVLIIISATIGILGYKNKDVQKIFENSKPQWWRWIIEACILIITMKMGYHKIAVCMFYEQSAVIYMIVAIEAHKKDEAAS